MPPIEQNKVKRAGVGLKGLDVERACPGYTLFTPFNDENRSVYLIDLAGTVVHTWSLPYTPIYGYLTERGTLVYNGRIFDEEKRFISDKPWKSGVILEADWNGRILWEVRHPDHHHDGIRLRNGNVLLICLGLIPDELVPQIQGGRPGTEAEGHMYADYLVELTTEGKVVWEWRCWEHLDPTTDRIIGIQEDRDVWTHGNSIAELADGNILMSFRNLSTVAIISRETSEITWKLGAPPLAQQHSPIPLPNGNILLFDNGTHRLDMSFPFSRVLEIDPTTKQIVWTYQEKMPFYFFSGHISGAQRLPNGNTLICEGAQGRFFEVTSEGEVVWEYINPYFGTLKPRIPEQNWVYRVYRHSEDEIARARATAGSGG
jgi:Arylsulfotransferase (ASST)